LHTFGRCFLASQFIAFLSNIPVVFFFSTIFLQSHPNLSLLAINLNSLTCAIRAAIKTKQTDFFLQQSRTQKKTKHHQLAPINNKIIKYFMVEIYRSGFGCFFFQLAFYVVFAIKRNMVGLPFVFGLWAPFFLFIYKIVQNNGL
jgi:hypothetical protein